MDLEALKRKRTQLRRAFTTTANLLEEALKKASETVEVEYAMLTDCAEELFSCEEAIRDAWCQSEDFDEVKYQEDQDTALTYRSRWALLRTKVAATRSAASDNSSLVSAKSKQQNDKKLKMPKLEISKFDGEVKKWLLFWGQFKKIDSDPEIDDTDKFQYLLQSMQPGSSARLLVESYPPCGENYAKAIHALKSRFAQDDVLIETYVRGLIALMNEKGQNKNLSTLYDSLQTHLQALETLGVSKDKFASILLPMVESALPEEVLRAWNRHRASGESNNDLSKLVDFLRQEVESEERIALSRQHTSEPKAPTCCFVTETKPEKHSSPALCIWCDKETHCSVECHKGAKMTLQQRIEHIKSKKGCTICLRQNHTAKRCKSFPKCLVCKKRHSTLMCPDIAAQSSSKADKVDLEPPSKASSLHCEVRSTTLLQTVVVQVPVGSRTIRARALIDSGAQRSYIRSDLAKSLDLKPVRKEFVTHCLFGGIEEKSEERQVYDIIVKSVCNDFSCKLSVLEQNNICGFLPKVRANDIIQELKRHNITLTETADSPDDVTILIGADYAGLLLTRDFVQVSNGLTAVKTKMGWTIQGPITGIYSSLANATATLQCLAHIDVSDLWKLETLGIKDPAEQISKSQRDPEVHLNFEKAMTVNEEGHYNMSLPWCDVPRPQTNYPLALRRLNSTTKRLTQLDKIAQYGEIFPGADGTPRVAKVRVANGEKIRPAQRLFPLEVTSGHIPLPDKSPKNDTRTQLTQHDTTPRSRFGRAVRVP